MKKLLIITLLLLSSSIFSQSYLSWFNPVEKYSCTCNEIIVMARPIPKIGCNDKTSLVFQEGRRLEMGAVKDTSGQKVKIKSEPSNWSVTSSKGDIINFDSITLEASHFSADKKLFTRYSCIKVN
tara:strand:- start:141 stop:515 length:375 start_codon:yes stop_codon:yes gene_type:complete